MHDHDDATIENADMDHEWSTRTFKIPSVYKKSIREKKALKYMKLSRQCFVRLSKVQWVNE